MGYPSERGSWRPTWVASGPRATCWAWGPGSLSCCRRQSRPQPPIPLRPPPRVPAGQPGAGCGYWQWTTAQTLCYVRDSLARAGYAPIVTGDRADVPRFLSEDKPRLALLDLALPDTGGIELIHGILILQSQIERD